MSNEDSLFRTEFNKDLLIAEHKAKEIRLKLKSYGDLTSPSPSVVKEIVRECTNVVDKTGFLFFVLAFGVTPHPTKGKVRMLNNKKNISNVSFYYKYINSGYLTATTVKQPKIKLKVIRMTSNNILSPQPKETKYLVYQTTNLINNKIYIGAHACTCEECKYMGSGNYIGRAIKKYGKEHFSKEILFEYNNEEEMYKKEKELVTDEFINRNNTYNLIPGGKGGASGYVSVTDGINTFAIKNTDPLYLSGQCWALNKKENNGMFGKTPFMVWEEKYGTAEAIRRQEERNRKAREKLKGKKHTPEAIEKNRIAHLGKIPWNKGLKIVTPSWNKGLKGVPRKYPKKESINE